MQKLADAHQTYNKHAEKEGKKTPDRLECFANLLSEMVDN